MGQGAPLYMRHTEPVRQTKSRFRSAPQMMWAASARTAADCHKQRLLKLPFPVGFKVQNSDTDAMPPQVVHKYDMDQRTKSYLARKLGCYVTELSQFYSLDQTQTGNVTRFVSSSILSLAFEVFEQRSMRRKSRRKSGLGIQFSLSLALHSLNQMQTGNLTPLSKFL